MGFLRMLKGVVTAVAHTLTRAISLVEVVRQLVREIRAVIDAVSSRPVTE